MGPVKIGFQPPAPAQGGTGRAEEDINKYTNIGAGWMEVTAKLWRVAANC